MPHYATILPRSAPLCPAQVRQQARHDHFKEGELVVLGIAFLARGHYSFINGFLLLSSNAHSSGPPLLTISFLQENGLVELAA
jgi:hypothetical protein